MSQVDQANLAATILSLAGIALITAVVIVDVLLALRSKRIRDQNHQ